MIHGITVTLYEKTQSGTDAFNQPIYTEEAVEVENVLVSPQTQGGDELFDETDLASRKAVYILGVPKGDSHTWENCKVEFFGETFQVIGKPTQGIEAMIPLSWNKKVLVEQID